MNYKITISNPGNHFHNPLLKLANETYATREEACEALYDAMYNTIDGEGGCEMVATADYCQLEDYAAACREYIMREGCASEDGVSATVEEVES